MLYINTFQQLISLRSKCPLPKQLIYCDWMALFFCSPRSLIVPRVRFFLSPWCPSLVLRLCLNKYSLTFFLFRPFSNYPVILPASLSALHYFTNKPWLPRSPWPPSSLPMQDPWQSEFTLLYFRKQSYTELNHRKVVFNSFILVISSLICQLFSPKIFHQNNDHKCYNI